jgi:hypothetical protein
MRTSFLVTFLFLVVSSGCGISLPDQTCSDCGTCGISSPTGDPGKQISVLGPGVTTGGLAAVDLGLEDGACIASDRQLFRVSYSAGKVTVAPADGLPRLDAAATTDDGNDVFTWKDRPLSASFDFTGATVSITFNDKGIVTKVACDGADHVITCTPE